MKKILFASIVFLVLQISTTYAQNCSIEVRGDLYFSIPTTETHPLGATHQLFEALADYAHSIIPPEPEFDINLSVSSTGTWSLAIFCTLPGKCKKFNTDEEGTWDVVCYDTDLDGIPDNIDNCPDVANPHQEDADINGIGDACDDSDGDNAPYSNDNCPNTANPNQEDADNDGIGDVCDENTIYGNISGAAAQQGITVNIYILNCGAFQPYATATADAQGYYATGDLPNARYLVSPGNDSYYFSSNYWVDIPQDPIQSYDFTSTVD